MFTRLLVGLDGSPRADSAFEQAVFLGKRFGSTIIVAYVKEPDGRETDGPAMLDRARERVMAAGLAVEITALSGQADSNRDFREIDANPEGVFVVEERSVVVGRGNQRAVESVDLHGNIVSETVVDVAHLRADRGVRLFLGFLRRDDTRKEQAGRERQKGK